MSAGSRVICPGCGQNVDPSQNGGKPKMRCPGCGVMLDLRDMPGYDPKAQTKSKSSKTAEPGAIDQESPFESNPFLSETKKKKPKADSTTKKAKAETAQGTAVPIPAGGPMDPPPLPFAPAAPSFPTSLEDDGLPYAMPGGFDFPCPDCTMLLKPGTAFCTRCGFDLRTGKKKKTTVKPLSRWYGPAFTYKARAAICIVVPPVMMLGLYFLGHLDNTLIGLQIVGWILLTFFLGTWGELHMERSSKGKTTFTRSMRVAFMPIPAGVFDADYFDGVSTRIEEQITFVDYIILLSLIGMGIIPGVIFYFAVMNRPEHAIHLTGEHGASLQDIFRSRNHQRILDILDEISKISGLQKRL